VDREEAEKALAIIRKVVQSTQEDLIVRNWGLIWMVHAFTNLAAFASIGLFVEARGLPVYWYLVPLAIVAAVDLAIVLLLAQRGRGVRSYVEWQLHGIWSTFIAFSVVAVGYLYLAQAPPTLLCPILAMTSGIGFAMMGVVFYRRFLGIAALFMLVMLVAPLALGLQWTLLGLAWWVGLFVPGLSMYRERRRRLQDESEVAIL
jgi:hypothetical protein